MLVIGAKGFAKEIIDIVCQVYPDKPIVFYDDMNSDAPDLLFERFPVLRSSEEAQQHFSNIDNRFVLGLGIPELRFKMVQKFSQLGGQPVQLISPTASIGGFGNSIGAGVNIMNHVVIEASNTIGAGSLLHNACFISHDVKIGDFCEISPSVNLLGNTEVGNFCSIGTGAVLLPGIKVGSNVIIGAGSVVTKDVPDNCMAVGTPAVVIKNLQPLAFL